MLEEGVKELWHDFEMGVATRLRNNSKAWHTKSPPPFCDDWTTTPKDLSFIFKDILKLLIPVNPVKALLLDVKY